MGERTVADLLSTIARIALRIGEPYLVASTALSELAVFAAARE
jgi:hypothetical protein